MVIVFVALFKKEIFQLKMDKKPCRKNSVLFLIPHIGLVVNVQLVVPGGGGDNYNLYIIGRFCVCVCL